MAEQFSSQRELTRYTEGARVKHFTPEKGEWDRFGNYLYVSKDLAYLDGTGDKVKAGILISPEGGKFIKQHPGVLKEIDSALSNLEDADGNNILGQSINLGNDGTLETKVGGGQSNFYILTVDREKYAIKTHVPDDLGHVDGLYMNMNVYQPYINEMLQTQSLAMDLKSELSSLGVKMSTFLFASGQVSCSRYEVDERNYNALNEKKLENLMEVAEKYLLKEKSKKNQLWDHVQIDLNSYMIRKALKNFRTKKDGTMVWIDPFILIAPKI